MTRGAAFEDVMVNAGQAATLPANFDYYPSPLSYGSTPGGPIPMGNTIRRIGGDAQSLPQTTPIESPLPEWTAQNYFLEERHAFSPATVDTAEELGLVAGPTGCHGIIDCGAMKSPGGVRALSAVAEH